MKEIYLVRHCKATGQAPEAPLTAEGFRQADALADHWAGAGIERIVSSPFLRATQSITPLVRRLGLPLEIDDRLSERVFSAEDIPDWREKLQISYRDLDFCLEGGESSRTAMQRAVAVVEDLQIHPTQRVMLVTHGNLMTLLLKHFDDTFGYSHWQGLTNPDVYRMKLTSPPQIERQHMKNPPVNERAELQ